MGHLQIAKLRAAKLETDPFEYVVVPAFLNAVSLKRINATFPAIAKGGSYPIESLDSSLAINEVIDELDGPEFERAIAEKFGIDLSGRPKMYSLRGWVGVKDGQIHTDSEDKIITVLLYLNANWPHAGTRLRLLRNGTDLENFVTEVPGFSISHHCLANGSDGYVYPIRDLRVWRLCNGASTTAAIPRGTRIWLEVGRTPISTVLGALEHDGSIALLPCRVEDVAPRFLVLVNASAAVIANAPRRRTKASAHVTTEAAPGSVARAEGISQSARAMKRCG